MLDHISMAVSNYEAAKQFYQQALYPLDCTLELEVDGFAGFQQKNSCHAIPSLWIYQSEKPTKNMHLAFTAETRKAVDEFYQKALEAGAIDNGKPGVRSEYHADYYAAFVFDLDGNNIEAVCHTRS